MALQADDQVMKVLCRRDTCIRANDFRIVRDCHTPAEPLAKEIPQMCSQFACCLLGRIPLDLGHIQPNNGPYRECFPGFIACSTGKEIIRFVQVGRLFQGYALKPGLQRGNKQGFAKTPGTRQKNVLILQEGMLPTARGRRCQQSDGSCPRTSHCRDESRQSWLDHA